MKNQSFLHSFPWWGPLLLILLIAPFSSEWDLALSRYAYGDGHFSSNPFFLFFYNWGAVPAIAVAAISLFFVAAGFFSKKIRVWRKGFLFLFLTFIIGSGIITNSILKDHWGRPRPRQVTEFGGTQEFRPFYSPNLHEPEPSKSFPCCHCTTGFYFFSLVFLGRRIYKPWLSAAGWILAFSLGLALSATRIFQGGHFLTDTIVAGIVMWYTALIIDWLLYSDS